MKVYVNLDIDTIDKNNVPSHASLTVRSLSTLVTRTMCPPGYHHNGIMAARELGHTMYGYTLGDCIVESPEYSNCEQ